jgi:opine dehydrogenase
LEFRRVLSEAGCRAHVLLGEANTFPIAARNTGVAEAVIFGTKAELLAASLPADRTEDLIATCCPFLPMIVPARSVLHTGLSNLGAILHPTIMLLNSHRIERGDVFDFYTDGVSTHVAEILARADLERIRIAEAYGERVQSLVEWIATAYGHSAGSMQAAVGGNPAYVGIKAPSTLNHRYLWEDVPTGLIPLLALSDAAGLDSPTLRSLVRLARLKLGGVRWQNPRTLASLGLAGCSTAEVRRVVSSGEYRNATAVPSRQPLFAGIQTGRGVA